MIDLLKLSSSSVIILHYFIYVGQYFIQIIRYIVLKLLFLSLSGTTLLLMLARITKHKEHISYKVFN
jgi:hypothetical protein